ncbi:liprin-beta-1-like isoform X2 [Ostrea edulis]|uniref:liprin-beta-1-like isoform X2 n=1 Tax=Ostrea edulis TaxID=37623 RepID=UPI0020955928|nr:liprin-beta-1-like isoform X2 [Ostrea edulis]
MYCIDKSMHKQTSRIANSEDRKCEDVNYADHCHGNKAISTTNSMSSSQNDESQGQSVFSRSWHHGLSNSDHPELRFVNDFDSHRRLSHGSRTALLGSHDSHLRLRDPKFAYTSSSPEKSPGIESDDSLSSASSGGPRQTTAYRKRSLRHRRSEDRDLSKLLASSVEESESYQKLQLGDDDGRSSRLGQRNGHRPASVCGYNVLWENRVQELVELLTRTSLETHKLDLMAEISSLKIKLASADKDRRDLDDRLRLSQRHAKELESRLAVKDAEINELRQKLLKNGTISTPDSSEHEVEKLKKAVEALMFSNQEKDKRIEELRRLLKRYRKIEEMVVQVQGRKVLEEMILNAEDDTSSTSSTTPSLSDNVPRDQQSEDGKERPYPNPSATSTPVHSLPENGIGTGNVTVLSGSSRRALQRSNSAEDVTPNNQKKKSSINNNEPEGYHNGGSTLSFGTFPGEGSEVRRSRGFPALGKALLRVKTGKRSTSAPNLANTEIVTDDEDGLQHVGSSRPPDVKKKKGIRGLFGKLKRSGSQDFHERERDQFRRGGVRATATARLGWSRDVRSNDEMPFNRWDCERVCLWMNDMGLNMYLMDCRRWVKNGEQLLRATAHELEKELGVKNPLHRKKLQLALQQISSTGKVKKQDLDHHWVTRWLDDIGLPQYKDNFYDGRVDGLMLHYLTVEDLLFLRVTNELHHISIKRGIQVLHAHGFNPQCLRRRPSPDEGQLQNIPADVSLWTNHRVMEWLRTIDLSEYAPNLRGSGVHGALIVLEPRFNAELFAQILSIPQNKTLLRRHLSTHVVALIGNETQHKKREAESSPGYVQLLPSAKVKSKKFGIFGHKRNKSDADLEDFICPDFTRRQNGVPQSKERDEKAAKEIGAYSKEINTLTDMLARDKFLDNVPTSNV